MLTEFDKILKSDPELRNQLLKELISEDEEVRKIIKKKVKRDAIKEVISNDKDAAKELLKESLLESEESKPSESLIKKTEKDRVYEILNKINSSEKETTEPKEEKYALSDLFTTMVVFGEKIGQSYSLIADERKNSNRILLNVNGALENLSERMKRIENKSDVILGTPRHVSNAELLAEKDIEILNIVDEMGKVCADDIKEKFDYKNRNAASARLNRLEERGLLKKQYVGRNVYYTLTSLTPLVQP